MDVVISFETLFEILRTERSRTELQKLPDSYIEDVKRFVLEIKRNMEGISSEDQRREESHLKNITKIANEIYERRERKIINMALDKSRTKAAIIDFSRFLSHEKSLFDQILDILDCERKKYQLEFEEKKISEPDQKSDEMEKAIAKPVDNYCVVRFLNHMPSFLGPGLETYGPFLAEDIASLPCKIADLLAEKKRAEKIRIS